MTQYIKHPDMITIAPDFSGVAINQIPAGYYRVGCNMQVGFHLVPVLPLNTPDKIYGSLLRHVPRIMDVFEERQGVSTTVMLEGLKGSGKSLMMKTIAKDFVATGGIVLLVNEPYTGSDFFEFMQSIEQSKVVLMDEFDKVYASESDRNSILTLLDGNYASHTLYVLTMNADSSSKRFEFFANRPGRVFFNIKFSAVDYEAIAAYLEDNLTDKERVGDVLQFTKRFIAFNMDMLGTLVREVNAVPHLTVDEIGEYLNVKPDIKLEDLQFTAQVFLRGLNVTDSLRNHCYNSDSLRAFLSHALGDARYSNQTINIDSLDECLNDKGKPRPYNMAESHADYDSYIYRVRATTPEGKMELIDPFDLYISSESAEIERDMLSGTTTCTVQSDEGELKLIIQSSVRKAFAYHA